MSLGFLFASHASNGIFIYERSDIWGQCKQMREIFVKLFDVNLPASFSLYLIYRLKVKIVLISLKLIL